MHIQPTLEAVALTSGVTVTLNFADYHEAARALARLAGIGVIAHEDRPDVGTPPAREVFAPPAVPPTPPTPPAAQVFAAAPGGAVVPAAPPVPPVAPSTAAVVPPPSAPVAPPAGSIPQPPAAAPSAPSPVPAAPAPSAPAGLTTLANGVIVDKLGTPWDGRIHSETKTIKKDGTWRQKRGFNDEAAKHRIENELRASVAALLPPGFVSAPAPTPAATPAAAPAMPTPPAAAPVPAPAAQSPTPPVTPSGPPAAPATVETFSTVAARMASYIAAGKITNDQVTAEVVTLLGAGAAFAGLAARPDLVPYFGQRLDTLAAGATTVAA